LYFVGKLFHGPLVYPNLTLWFKAIFFIIFFIIRFFQDLPMFFSCFVYELSKLFFFLVFNKIRHAQVHQFLKQQKIKKFDFFMVDV